MSRTAGIAADRQPAERLPARAAAHPEQHRHGDSAHRRIRVPVAERIAQARAAAEPLADLEHVGEEAAAQAQKHGDSDAYCNPFCESFARFGGLGDKESGKEEAEIDEHAVGLDHAQLDRPRPEG